MEQTIVLQIFPDENAVEWVMLDEKGEVVVAPNRIIDENFSHYLRGSKVLVIVPGIEVLLRSLDVPKMSRTKMLKAIPNMLEDDLMETADHLHFAIGEYRPGRPVSVAVISKQKIREWLDFLREKIPNIQGSIKTFVPETLCLSWVENTWSGLLRNKQVFVRSGLTQGYVVDENNFVMITNNLMDQGGMKNKFHAYSLGVDIQGVNELSVEVEKHLISEPLLTYYAKNIQNGVSLNLLQGAFAQKNNTDLTKKIYTYAGILIVIWLSLLTVIDGVKYYFLNNESEALNEQIDTAYKEIFPHEVNIANPKQRIVKLLNEINGTGSTNQLMKLLAKISPLIDRKKGITLQEFEYSNGALELKMEASDFALLDELVVEVKQQGLSAVQNQASKVEGKIQSRMTVK